MLQIAADLEQKAAFGTVLPDKSGVPGQRTKDFIPLGERTARRGVLPRSCDGKQALAEWGAHKSGFEPMDDGENHSVIEAHLLTFEHSFFQHTKIQPPGKVPDQIEVMKPFDSEPGLAQLRA